MSPHGHPFERGYHSDCINNVPATLFVQETFQTEKEVAPVNKVLDFDSNLDPSPSQSMRLITLESLIERNKLVVAGNRENRKIGVRPLVLNVLKSRHDLPDLLDRPAFSTGSS